MSLQAKRVVALLLAISAAVVGVWVGGVLILSVLLLLPDPRPQPPL
jgi:hypothetical protein